MTITESEITKSHAQWGGGIYNVGTLNLTNTSISNNTVIASGGGIYNPYNATVTLVGCTISGNKNSSTGYVSGGGIYNQGWFTITDSVISDNTLSTSSSFLAQGAGIYNSNSMTLINSVVTGNVSSHHGGGIYNISTLTLTNTTVAGNSAKTSGGGIWTRETFNSDSTIITINNSIVANNYSPNGAGYYGEAGSGSNGQLLMNHSLIGDNVGGGADYVTTKSSAFEDPTLVVGQPAGFVASPEFAINGNPIHTDTLDLRLKQTSAARNTGDNLIAVNKQGSPLTVDRDGNSRVILATVDMGAYEAPDLSAAPVSLVVSTVTDENDDDHTDGDLSLREALYLASQGIADGLITFDATLFGTPQTITLARGLGSLAIVGDVRVIGPGADKLAIDGNNRYSVFQTRVGQIILSGLTVQNGLAQSGAGILNQADLTLEQCIVTGNHGSLGGAGINSRRLGRSLTLIDCEVTHNVVSGSMTECQGVGISVANGDLTVINSLVARNLGNYPDIADSLGGGIFLSGGNGTIVNSTIAANQAVTGGGVYFENGYNKTLALHNSIISGNFANTASGLYLDANYNFASNIRYNLIGGNSGSSNIEFVNNYQAVPFDASNMIGIPAGFMVAPQFDNAGKMMNSAFVDLRLSANSFAIDAGNNALAVDTNGFTLADDVTGNRRIVASLPGRHAEVDLGAYEYQAAALSRENASSTVTTALDVVNPTDGVISLREALIYTPAEGTITFANSLDGAVSRLQLGEITLFKPITIDASSLENGFTLDANEQHRVMTAMFNTDNAANVIKNLTLTGGVAQFGGGLLNYSNMTLVDCSLTGNKATDADNKQYGAFGGGIYTSTQSDESPLKLEGCLVSNNQVIYESTKGYSTAGGGGIFGRVHVYESTVTGNSVTLTNSGTGANDNANAFGGGIGGYANIIVEKSTVSDNHVMGTGLNVTAQGGGISNIETGVSVIDSFVTGNTATVSGDNSASQACGGGIAASTLNAVNSLIADNSVSAFVRAFGGGILVRDLNRLVNCTIAGNSAVATHPNSIASFGGGIASFYGQQTPQILGTIHNSIIAQNTADTNPDIQAAFGRTNPSLHNTLIGDATGLGTLPTDAAGNLLGSDANPVDPRFVNAPNGNYHLTQNSPAVNQGNNALAVYADSSAITHDVDGETRIFSNMVDMGALEYSGTIPEPIADFVVTTLVDEIDENNPYGGTGLSLREALYLAQERGETSSIAFASYLFDDGTQILTIDRSYGPLRLDNVELEIIGPGRDWLTIQTSDYYYETRAFVFNNCTVTMSGMTISGFAQETGNEDLPYEYINGGITSIGGSLTLENMKLVNNGADYGGAIRTMDTELTIKNSTIDNNQSSYGGNGIYCEGVSVVTVTNSSISNNVSRELYNQLGRDGISVSGTLNITGSTVSGNQGRGIGVGGQLIMDGCIVSNNSEGGINIVRGNNSPLDLVSSVSNSTISGNHAYENGGGILSTARNLVVTNTTISGNTVTASGYTGPMYQYFGIGGGGIFSSGNLTLEDCTITDNIIDQGGNLDYWDGIMLGFGGGGVHSLGGTLTVIGGSISKNHVLVAPPNSISGDYYQSVGFVSGGGGILHTGRGVDISGATISENSSGCDGGGILIGTVTQTVDSSRIRNTVISDNMAISAGGGLVYTTRRNELAPEIELTNVDITGNIATGGYGGVGHAGGMFINSSLATMTGCNVSGNTAEDHSYNRTHTGYPYWYSPGEGGGIINTGTLVIKDSTVSGNVVEDNVEGFEFYDSMNGRGFAVGGGISNRGVLRIENSMITKNVAESHNWTPASMTEYDRHEGGSSGGAIFNDGSLTIVNSVISENCAETGAAVWNPEAYDQNRPVSMTLVNTTVAGNSAVRRNGEMGTIISAIYYGYDYGIPNTQIHLLNSIISDNYGIGYAGNIEDLYLINTLIGGHQQDIGRGGGVYQPEWQLFEFVLENELVGAPADFVVAPVFDEDGRLLNADKVDLHLKSSSLAIDAGNNSLAHYHDSELPRRIETDLDGNLRVAASWGGYNAVCDLGAYEYQESITQERETSSTVVTTTEDVVNPFDGVVSLREAIFYANNGDTVTFDVSLNGATILLNASELTITKAITVSAAGLAGGITIDGQEKTLLIYAINPGPVPLTLEYLTLTKGRTAITNVGLMQLVHCTVTENYANYRGGGIINNGTLMIDHSVISNNSAYSNGGGIANSGSLSITNSQLSRNRVIHDFSDTYNGTGGAISNQGGFVDISNTLINDNSASYGGGIYSRHSYSPFAQRFTNVTITGNTATQQGGGICNYTDSYYSDPIFFNNTIIAGNSAPEFPDLFGFFTADHSLIGDIGVSGDVIYANGNIFGTIDNPIDPLFVDAGNGDYRLAANSPAIDTGNNLFVPEGITTDLAGNDRFQGIAVDIGAYESLSSMIVVSTVFDENDGIHTPGNLSLREAIEIAKDVENAVIVFDSSLFAGGKLHLALESELLIKSNITIFGSGVTLDGQNKSRLFNIAGTSRNIIDVTLHHLTLTGGYHKTYGGAVYATYANTVWQDVTFTNNQANNGGAFYQKNGTSIFSSVQFASNTSRYGGAFYMADGEANFAANSRFERNSAKWGGAVYLAKGNLNVTNSTLASNTATWGGGIYLAAGNATLSDTTFSGNGANRNLGSGMAKSAKSQLTVMKNNRTILDTALAKYLDEYLL